MRRRTNIYLDDRQLRLLKLVALERDSSVAELVRAAVDQWLGSNGVEEIPDDEWGRRFDVFLERRRRVQEELGFTDAEVERAVNQAVREVREERARRARGR